MTGTDKTGGMPPVRMPAPKQKTSRAVPILSVLCILFLVTTLAFGFIALKNSLLLSQIQSGESLYDREKLAYVMNVFSQYSIYDMPTRDALTDDLISAFIARMGDKHAAYFDKDSFAAWQDDLAGSFSGIGVSISPSLDGKGLELLDVFPDSPAEKAGLVPGDILIRAGERNYENTDTGYAAFVAAIVGEEGTEVSLTFLRGGSEYTCTATRGKVVNRSVLWHLIEEAPQKIGYIRVTGFDEHTYAQFKAAVDAVEAEGVSGIVFDVRNNGGGLLNTACEMLAYLLPDGDIVSVHYGSEQLKDYTIRCEDGRIYYENGPRSFEDGRHALNVPVAVLVNGNTASAAELFTSALRDYAADGRMTVTTVGSLTYGKGTMQTTFSMGDDTGFKLTIAHYDPPCGQNYDGIGITPDLPVSPDPGQENANLYRLTYATDAQLRAAVAALCG